ncbi:MAG: hypothetical protein AAGB05_06325 [Pseudomonadota bacterium]
MVRALHEILLNDLENPPGLTPLFGEAERESVLFERMRTERLLAGQALQNVTALLACMSSNLTEHANGTLTAEQLVEEIDHALRALRAELTYDESKALTSDTAAPVITM